ncbi:uncharacterized protein LOC118790658 [Megalops cyprinoides]|uniref:uncharacterized protein LOC118790658 n=1 Tax=Megalops cyprinoides TaxID=118141 RepID=UPI0018650912|nr:uncharacterized protein LOC118790658 [Megalops cyprinoides]
MVSLCATGHSRFMERVSFQLVSLCFYAQYVMTLDISIKQVGQLGDSITLHPAFSNNHVHDARWKKSNKLLKGFINRSESFANGSMLLSTAIKNDSGNYTVELFNLSGHLISTTHIELIILEAVSQPDVHTSCTPDGHIVMTCSVDRGDQVRLYWTGDADVNPQPEQRQTEWNLTLFFSANTSDLGACVAENQVSNRSSGPISQRCSVGNPQYGLKTETDHILLWVLLGLIVGIAALSMAVLFKLCKKPVVHSEDAEDNVYVTMAGCQEMRDRAEPNKFKETDDSLYVTCRSQRANQLMDMSISPAGEESIYV